MHARVSIATTQPGKVDDLITVYRDSVLPAAKKQKGFKGLSLLTDYHTGKGIAISLWGTEADMTAMESSVYIREQSAKVIPLLAGTPAIEHYEVTVRG